jgi:oxygen-independent coproporphyrinogen-3 oxidase
MNSMGQNENWFETEILSAKEHWNELILTGLRTKFGVSLEMLYKLYEPDRDFLKKVEEFKSKGWMSEFDLHLILTKEGRLKADYIASELFLV